MGCLSGTSVTPLPQVSHPRSCPVDKKLIPCRGAEPTLKPSLLEPDLLQKTSHLSGQSQQIDESEKLKGLHARSVMVRGRKELKNQACLCRKSTLCTEPLLCAPLPPCYGIFLNIFWILTSNSPEAQNAVAKIKQNNSCLERPCQWPEPAPLIPLPPLSPTRVRELFKMKIKPHYAPIEILLVEPPPH